VADALDISRRTYRKIQQGLFWAFVYNVVGIPLAASRLVALTRTAIPTSRSAPGASVGSTRMNDSRSFLSYLHSALWSARPREHTASCWLSHVFVRKRSDDDDDPPPCPASAAIPIPMPFVLAVSDRNADGALTQKARSNSMAEGKAKTQPRLSAFIRDPFVRAAFERAERDPGATPVEPPRQNKPLQGGAAAKLPRENVSELSGVGTERGLRPW